MRSMPAENPPTRINPPISGTRGRSGLCISLPTSPRRLKAGIATRKATKAAENDTTNIEMANDIDAIVMWNTCLQPLRLQALHEVPGLLDDYSFTRFERQFVRAETGNAAGRILDRNVPLMADKPPLMGEPVSKKAEPLNHMEGMIPDKMKTG